MKVYSLLCTLFAFVLMSCDSPTEQKETTESFFPDESMVLIPAEGQTFSMGWETSNFPEWGPEHLVTLSHSFYMDTTEVTQAEYEELMIDTPWNSWIPETWEDTSDIGSGDLYPAVIVSWYDAIVFCNTKSKRYGYDTVYTYDPDTLAGKGAVLQNVEIDYSVLGFRLPTEAEWEFAAKGGVESFYYWGDDYGDGHWYEWLDNAYTKSVAHQVAAKRPNPYGLYDMGSNVAEMCNDYYGEHNATATTDPTGPATGDKRVTKSSSVMGTFITDNAGYARRGSIAPDYKYEGSTIGFRVVLPIQTKENE